MNVVEDCDLQFCALRRRYLDGNELVGALAWMPVDEHEMATTSRDNTISTFRHAVLSARKAMRQLDFDVCSLMPKLMLFFSRNAPAAAVVSDAVE